MTSPRLRHHGQLQAAHAHLKAAHAPLKSCASLRASSRWREERIVTAEGTEYVMIIEAESGMHSNAFGAETNQFVACIFVACFCALGL